MIFKYMNTIFIDVNDLKDKGNEKNKIFNTLKQKLFKVSITRDFTNDKFNKNIFLQIDKDFLDSTLKKKRKISEFFIKLFLKNEYKKDTDLFVVMSKEIDKNKEYKKYILNLINVFLGNTLKVNEIKTQNNMLKHDTVYIDTLLDKKDVKLNKANILIVVNNIKDFKEEKIIEYIKKYKYVDILRLNGISKREHKILLEKINNINDEYGTTIEIIQRRNISEYDVYVFYSNIELEQFKDHYILNRELNILDTKNEEQDTLSLSYRTYKKNKYELEALFNRINCDMNRFSKNKLGNLFTKKS